MRYNLFIAVAIAGIATAFSAHAQKLEGTFKDWKVITVDQDGKQVCYLHSSPVKKSGSNTSRNEPYVLLTSRGSKKDEVSISAGYPYKAKSEVSVKIDGKEFSLFTKDDLAWAYSEKQDGEISAALRKGKQMVISSQDQQERNSQDTYSLNGIGAAYKKMKSICK